MSIERSPGLIVTVGATSAIVGGGYSGATDELDELVQRAARMLADAYSMPVCVRFNSDRASGGAWLKTHDVDGVGRNSEIGLWASLVTERQVRARERYPDWDTSDLPPAGTLTVGAHLSEQASDQGYHHEAHATLEDALAFVQAHGSLPSATALVKCGSHRARGKLLALVGQDNAEALFSMHRETGKGVYRIPAEQAPAAKAITGVSGFRDGDDLMRCWTF